MLYNNKGKKIEDCIEFKTPSIITEKIEPWKDIAKKYETPYTSVGYDFDKPFELKPKISAEIPLGNFTAKFSASEDEIRGGFGTGFGKAGYVGAFVNYDFKTGQVGLGGEVEAFNGMVKGEAIAGYSWQEDKLDLKLSTTLFDNKIDLVDFEVKDVAHNLIGKPLDAMVNGVQDFYNHVSPQAREYQAFVSNLREKANEVSDIGGLGDIIRLAGENEAKMKGGEASFQLHRATYNYLEQLDNRVSVNTQNIEINSKRLDYQEGWLRQHDVQIKQQQIQINNHEIRLNHHDKILSVHAQILASNQRTLNRHENLLNIHTKLITANHLRLNRHELIINNLQKIINQHESILKFQANILRNHEQQLHQHAMAINELFSISYYQAQVINAQGKKIKELDTRMYIAENNIMYLNKQVEINTEILSHHGEILSNQGKCISELYQITNDQQIQLNMHDQLINEHQQAIVGLCRGFHKINERINQDEKVINKIGQELSKVINLSIDTRSLVEGLSQQTQIHRDLIVQNYEGIKEAKIEIRNHMKIILEQQEFMNEMAKRINLHEDILIRHDQEINELKAFVVDLNKEIGNIYNEIDMLKNKMDELEKKLGEDIEKKINYEKEKNKIEEKVNELIEKVDNFDENKKWDFIKCMYMAINMGVYNLHQMEIVVKNIEKVKT